jgi:hypothetical protein
MTQQRRRRPLLEPNPPTLDSRGHRWLRRPGKRITRKASGKTKTEAKTRLKEILSDVEDGIKIVSTGYTVADAVQECPFRGGT